MWKGQEKKIKIEQSFDFLTQKECTKDFTNISYVTLE